MTTADFMDFGTWLDMREELMMLVIAGSSSLLLSLMSQESRSTSEMGVLLSLTGDLLFRISTKNCVL